MELAAQTQVRTRYICWGLPAGCAYFVVGQQLQEGGPDEQIPECGDGKPSKFPQHQWEVHLPGHREGLEAAIGRKHQPVAIKGSGGDRGRPNGLSGPHCTILHLHPDGI